jgi:hypothetical protein
LYEEEFSLEICMILMDFCLVGDDHGAISIFENLKFKFKMNIVEHVKGLYIEKNFVYSLANMDLR